MLRAVPVERGQMDQHGPFRLGFIARNQQALRKFWVGREILDFDMAENFEPRPVRIIHQEQGRPVIAGKIAQADILPVAAKIREAQGPLIQHAQKPGRAAAMLQIRPAILRHGCHIETIARRDERRLCRGKPIPRPIHWLRPELGAAIRGLRRLHAPRR
jgi:hypothetical protein